MAIKIDCYISIGCASEDALKRNLSEAIRLEGKDADMKVYRVDETKAQELGLKGSPTIFVNGIELQPQDARGFS